MSTNQPLKSFTLSNHHGVSIKIINLGGIITSIKTPDRNGKFLDIVLGFDRLKQYTSEHPYFGAIVGRYANRINRGKFNLDGIEYSLDKNNDSNHIHGGARGFDKVIWAVKPIEDENALQLTHVSKDGEENYPGNLSVKVTYKLTDENILKIRYEANTDETTVLNLSQHSYFNLSGNFSKNILDHELQINADEFLPINHNLIPTGILQSVNETPFDFRVAKKIGQNIKQQHKQLNRTRGYDHCWVVNKGKKSFSKIASVYHSKSRRQLDVFTDQPGLQFYSGNMLDNVLPSKTGGTYGPQSGFCLETQHFPNSPNEPIFPSTILNPGDTFTSETWFKFSVK